MYLVLVFVVFFITGLAIDIQALCCGPGLPWYTYFTYTFYHANIFHLALNSYSFIIYWRFLKQRIPLWWIIITIIVVPPLAGVIAAYHTTGGASTVVCSLMGIYLAFYKNKWPKYLFLFLINVVLGFFLPINTIIHIVGILISFLATCAFRKYLYVII